MKYMVIQTLYWSHRKKTWKFMGP